MYKKLYYSKICVLYIANLLFMRKCCDKKCCPILITQFIAVFSLCSKIKVLNYLRSCCILFSWYSKKRKCWNYFRGRRGGLVVYIWLKLLTHTVIRMLYYSKICVLYIANLLFIRKCCEKSNLQYCSHSSLQFIPCVQKPKYWTFLRNCWFSRSLYSKE